MALLSLLQMGWASMLLGFLLIVVFGVFALIGKPPKRHIWRIFLASGMAATLLAGLYGYVIYEGFHIYQYGTDAEGLIGAVAAHWVMHLLINIVTTIWLAWHAVVGVLALSDES